MAVRVHSLPPPPDVRRSSFSILRRDSTLLRPSRPAIRTRAPSPLIRAPSLPKIAHDPPDTNPSLYSPPTLRHTSASSGAEPPSTPLTSASICSSRARAVPARRIAFSRSAAPTSFCACVANIMARALAGAGNTCEVPLEHRKAVAHQLCVLLLPAAPAPAAAAAAMPAARFQTDSDSTNPRYLPIALPARAPVAASSTCALLRYVLNGGAVLSGLVPVPNPPVIRRIIRHRRRRPPMPKPMPALPAHTPTPRPIRPLHPRRRPLQPRGPQPLTNETPPRAQRALRTPARRLCLLSLSLSPGAPSPLALPPPFPKSSLKNRAWCLLARSRTVDARPGPPIVDVDDVEFECACPREWPAREDADVEDRVDPASEWRLFGEVCAPRHAKKQRLTPPVPTTRSAHTPRPPTSRGNGCLFFPLPPVAVGLMFIRLAVPSPEDGLRRADATAASAARVTSSGELASPPPAAVVVVVAPIVAKIHHRPTAKGQVRTPDSAGATFVLLPDAEPDECDSACPCARDALRVRCFCGLAGAETRRCRVCPGGGSGSGGSMRGPMGGEVVGMVITRARSSEPDWWSCVRARRIEGRAPVEVEAKWEWEEVEVELELERKSDEAELELEWEEVEFEFERESDVEEDEAGGGGCGDRVHRRAAGTASA
ncbi:hypothetical protein B0H14DRAFT_3776280 [Mycena olivaceomarginata]|nr:hypothetical protein B0H14DRAFT_3776280 [Mycena olivaceomarginata]